MKRQQLHLAGVGAGPFNLSIAALLSKNSHINFAFFDKKPAFSWHTGLMLDGARLQTSWMKDLVTPVDPTSEFSFLNFLVQNQRFYSFINAEQAAISRQEFEQYLRWASERIPGIEYGNPVREIQHKAGKFQVKLDSAEVLADNICIGTGTKPYVPSFASQYLGAHVFHGGSIMQMSRDFSNKRVVIVGGGQTGAELFLGAISERWGQCKSVSWLSRRDNFEPLDETPFTNDYFTPDYVQCFLNLDKQKKQSVVEKQKLASDGISPSTLKEIYQCLYIKKVVENNPAEMLLMPGRELTGMSRQSGGFGLNAYSHLESVREQLNADIVIFCTGFRSAIPECIEPLVDRLGWEDDGILSMKDNYQVNWEGESENRIYAVNTSRHHHGIVDPQTSMMAWRSATIVNDLSGYPLYNLKQNSMVQWSALTGSAQTNVA